MNPEFNESPQLSNSYRRNQDERELAAAFLEQDQLDLLALQVLHRSDVCRRSHRSKRNPYSLTGLQARGHHIIHCAQQRTCYLITENVECWTRQAIC